jgi:hypothetical protein
VLDPLARQADHVDVLSGVGRAANGGVNVQSNLPERADVVLIQRSFVVPGTIDYLNRILRTKKPVIYETDDYLLEIPAWHHKEYHRRSAALAEGILGECSLITVSTDALAEKYAGRFTDVRVVPNHLNEVLWDRHLTAGQKPTNEIRIGLIGTRGHWYDFQKIANPLRRTLQDFDHVRLIFKGVDPSALGVSGPHVTFIAPDMNYDAFIEEFRSLDLDVVLSLLVDHPFNRCRSDIKWLEAGFCGIPGVFEDLPPYNTSVVNGVTGLLARTEAEWRESIATLVQNAVLRRAIGSVARDRIVAGRTLATRSLDRLASVEHVLRRGS